MPRKKPRAAADPVAGSAADPLAEIQAELLAPTLQAWGVIGSRDSWDSGAGSG